MTLLALSLSILLAACKPDAAPAAPADAAAPVAAVPAAAEPTAAVTTADAGAACTYADFDTFLPHFGREIALQETSVADPLLSERYDTESQDEPTLVSGKVPLSEVTWPVMPNPSGLKDVGREMQVARQDDGTMKVLIRTPDTSNQQSYYFAQRPCWQLVRMTDESI
ncbi:hypothetical protein J7J08_05830 [Stenotrophomonas sp. ISL-67]|uniref:hypothetical protein n=1 Tax=Stenotrophomonas sp. ISL-67 TaxID=2819171 RepID=UPI001BE94EFA|nr:hypothetical protein [Stenotrophomonas sp. ISL-67]MBT2767150.1 hypothetical protein [Stenotrophomonas sp. ISL-67]